MREEHHAEILRLQRRQPADESACHGAPHHTRTGINQVGGATGDDGRRRPEPIRLGAGRAGAKQHDPGALRIARRCLGSCTRGESLGRFDGLVQQHR